MFKNCLVCCYLMRALEIPEESSEQGFKKKSYCRTLSSSSKPQSREATFFSRGRGQEGRGSDQIQVSCQNCNHNFNQHEDKEYVVPLLQQVQSL